MTSLNDIVFALIGYLAGSIPFGLILTRAAGLGDVRSIGSGNIGATNVLRTGNKGIAALTLLCDGLKGFFPVLAATHYGDVMAPFAAGFGALAGHILPVWLRFKGGKGVATGLGVLFGWHWMLGLAFVLGWIAMFLITRISSASALTACVVALIAGAILNGTEVLNIMLWPLLVLAAIIWITHRGNIGRLLKGEEPKSSFSKKA
jgi:glycerol-3-phosphate acyltransferase PlsY